MGNVHVMAGVPAIMRAMFDMLAPTLQRGTPVISRSVHAANVREGDIAAGLTAIQAKYPSLDLGSYPYYRDGGGGVAIVAKGLDAAQAEAAIAEVTKLFEQLGGHPTPGEPG
jgi:molybdopterin-biosynthesis enzyme MoeA-like protein